MVMPKGVGLRRCATCSGACRWDGAAWVCLSCYTHWEPQVGRVKYAPPSETRRLDTDGQVHAYALPQGGRDNVALCGYSGRSTRSQRAVTCVYCQQGQRIDNNGKGG